MDTNNMLSLLERLMPPSSDKVAHQIAADVKRRRIEKNITRRHIADKSGYRYTTKNPRGFRGFS